MGYNPNFNRGLELAPIIDDSQGLASLNKLLETIDIEAKAAAELYEQRISNENAIQDLKVKLASKARAKELELEKKATEEYLKNRQDLVDKEIKQTEKRAKRKVTPEERKAIEEKYKYDSKIKAKYVENARKKQKIADKKEAKERAEQMFKAQQEILFGKGHSVAERFGALKDLTTTPGASGTDIFKRTFTVLSKSISNMSQQLDRRIDEIAANKAAIDTRLQGSHGNTSAGSYWDRISKDITGIAGVSPLVKQADIVTNLKTLVGKGISYNVTQRAFLQSISEKIATTFNAADGTLLRLIRIQQQDTTAGRLGMESALNSFLNNMYETTEYMSDVMSSVKGSLEESMALMDGRDAVAFEYQVQKWMGSLYSVGMSQKAVSSISSALGQLAAGDINGLIGSNIGNLMVMAAGEANLELGDILAQGLDESSTNALLQAMVNYLASIYGEAEGSHLIQQQMANIYGVAASDLKAATNLANESTIKSIYGNGLNYTESIQQLMSMADSMYSRTSVGELMNNAWDNFQYTMAAGIANNPMTYAINKVAGLLDSAVGGIALPFVSVAGFGTDLNTTVADLMRVGAMSKSILSGIGNMLSAGGAGGINMSETLANLGISNSLNTIARGELEANERIIAMMQESGSTNIQQRNVGGKSTSASGMSTFTGNASGTDIKNATLAEAANSSKAQLAEASESEEAVVTTNVIDEHIVDIYSLLQEVVNGASALTVKLDYSITDRPWN